VRTTAVIGCGFGDEGKGRVVDCLCSQSLGALVVRFSGGHQAGHHVIRGNIDHVFSNFGCGALQGIPTYWTRYCTVDPVGIVNELEILRASGIKPHLFIDPRCPVTTLYDKGQNRIRDAHNQHGTCGVGFGATLQREADRYSLLFADLYNPTILQIKLKLIKDYYDFIPVDTALDNFLSCCDAITHSDNVVRKHGIPGDFELIFEGSQGLLLDQDAGFFPHVTRSNTGTKNILELGYEPFVYLVTRAYQTRHGNGPMTNQHITHHIKRNPYERNNAGGFQGQFRKTLLDVDLLMYAISRDEYIRTTPNKALVITCMDLIEGEWRYTLDGAIFEAASGNDFANKIRRHLGIQQAYVSWGPTGELVPVKSTE